MTDIPLIFEARGYVTVRVLIRAGRYHVCGPVKFYVDTGSPESLISEEDAKRLMFPITKLTYDKTSLMGGAKIRTAEVKDIELTFRVGEDAAQKIHMGVFRVAKSLWTKKEAIACSSSILGNDFLLKNKLSLHVNPLKNEAYYKEEA